MVRLSHAVDAGMGAAAVALVGAAQTAADVSPAIGDDLLLTVIREGGAWLIVALLLWFYRRDWHRLADQSAQLVSLTEKAAEAQKQMAVALAENTEVMREILDRREDRRR